MLITTIERPTVYPITLSEARTQCMIDDDITDEDTLISSFIAAAVDYCERYTQIAFIAQKKRYTGCFSQSVKLSPMVISIDSVAYIDVKEQSQELPSGSYYLDESSLVNALVPADYWPTVSDKHPSPVVIDFTCGYGDAAKVPDGIKQAIRLLVGHWYRNRDASVASVPSSLRFSVECLLEPYRVVGV